MLAVGELSVRRVSKFEATASASGPGTKLNFGHTSRLQVSCGHRYLTPPLCRIYVSSYLQLLLVALSVCNTVVSVKSLQDRLGLPFINQVMGWIIFGGSLSNQSHPARTNVIRLHRNRLSFPLFLVLLLCGSEDGRRAPTHLFSLLLPVLRRSLHQRRGSFLRVVLYDFVSLDSSRRGCAPTEGKI
jgi:hypothetical protein